MINNQLSVDRYEESLLIYNGAVTAKPLVVIRPYDANDVAMWVAFSDRIVWILIIIGYVVLFPGIADNCLVSLAPLGTRDLN